jgi:hypothetical protein
LDKIILVLSDWWKVRISEEIYLLMKHADIVRDIKAHGIGWTGHVVGMDKDRTVERIKVW